MKLHLTADTERYGEIADRWPAKITIEGTSEQLAHFLVHGVYEAGCEDLLVPEGEESECNERLVMAAWRGRQKAKRIK